MTQYADFRLVVTPDLAIQGNWLVAVDDCPIPGLIGPKGTVAPTMTRANLNTLRSRNGWPNVQTLKDIGAAAWQSVMTPAAEAAFSACIQAADANKGLRLVVVLQGEDVGVAGDATIRLSELPVESFFTALMQFIGTDLRTPISRSFQQRPDREPQRVELPLRVLVAVAAPTDRPPADTAKEVAVIKEAVRDLTGPGGMLDVDYIEQATREDVAQKLKDKPYHVLHFIGHGGFDIVGDVETPRAYLCFVRSDGSNLSDPTDADTLSTILRNSSVRLVVITACSSAAPTAPLPNDTDPGPLGTGAFDGVAQRLVTGIAPVTAAVGMQFDLENDAATEFSKGFYAHLLTPGLPLDEVVTLARRDLITRLQAGHRAWVTPAVYWRCIGGNVFDIDASVGKIDDATLAQIHDIEVGLDFHRAQVAKIVAKPPESRAALQPFLLESLTDIETMVDERWKLLGETVGLVGGRAAPGQPIACRLVLRMRKAGTVGSIRFRVEWPPTAATFASAAPGGDVIDAPATVVSGTGVDLVFLDPAHGASWKAGVHELGALNLTVNPGAEQALVDIKLTAVDVRRSGKAAKFRGVDGVLFVEGGA